jgi:CRP-like cAMP-binding protein
MTDCESVMNLLRQIPLFANLTDEDEACIEQTEEWRLPEGEMLVKEGEPAEHFFVLLEGEISVWKKHDDQEIVVARGRPGAFFGEVPLLLGTPYMLSGRAESDCRKRFGSCCAFAQRFRVRFSGQWRRVFAASRVQRDSKKSWRRSEQCPPA